MKIHGYKSCDQLQKEGDNLSIPAEIIIRLLPAYKNSGSISLVAWKPDTIIYLIFQFLFVKYNEVNEHAGLRDNGWKYLL